MQRYVHADHFVNIQVREIVLTQERLNLEQNTMLYNYGNARMRARTHTRV